MSGRGGSSTRSSDIRNHHVTPPSNDRQSVSSSPRRSPGTGVYPSRLASSKGQRMVQACDCCRKRKIKCDTRQPSCANCENAGILCQTLRTSRKRGRKALILSPAESQFMHPALQEPQSSGFIGTEHATLAPEQSIGERGSPLTLDEFAVPDAALADTYSFPGIADTPFALSDFHPLLANMAHEIFEAGITQSLLSYISIYVDVFFDNIYPTYPVVYRPTIEWSTKQLGTPEGWDIKMFTLITSLCAYTCATLPTLIPTGSWLIAEIFYQASKKGLDLYRDEDIENPDSTSIVIRSFHSGWVHASGKSNASWHVMGEAVRIAQVMRLHDEQSYERMPSLEGELCRRVFWTLFTGDKSAAVLGGHPICLNSDFFQNGINVRYPADFPNQDVLSVTSTDGSVHNLSMMTGFNANQDLWRAAEKLLAWDSDEVARIGAGITNTTIVNGNILASDFVRFRVCLDNLPLSLRFHSSVALSPAEFVFSYQSGRDDVPRALLIQRTNLHISYQCLKMVILRKFPTLYSNPSLDCLRAAPHLQYDSSDESSPASHHRITQHGRHNTPAFALETLRIAEDMMYIIYTSTPELIRVNGEACVEKIRLVGAAILELIANNPPSTLVSMAEKYRELYPHVLAMLESKASDAAEHTSGGRSGNLDR